MYVYIQTEPTLYTVGHYAPDGKWIPESDYEQRKDAAKRVSMLNGKSILMEDGIHKLMGYADTTSLLDIFEQDWKYNSIVCGVNSTFVSVSDAKNKHLFDVEIGTSPEEVIKTAVRHLVGEAVLLRLDKNKDEIRKALKL